jgi:RNA polymerase sigma factor (TIGR02999 family)
MSELERATNTNLLQRAIENEDAASEKLAELLYDELRKMAASQLSREPKNHTLNPTALAHEAFVRLIDQNRVQWRGRTHFLAVGAQAMRRILVDHARRKQRAKRGGDWRRVSLPEHLTLSLNDSDDVLAVHEALQQLADLDARQARIVELRFFGGLTAAEAADHLGLSKPTVDREWRAARAWLRERLSEGPDE